MDERVVTVGNLWHLEGRTVSILAAGGTEPDQVVSGGEITLENAASYTAIGLAYDGQFRTLPLKSDSGLVYDKKKSLKDVSLRVLDTRGLRVGEYSANTYYDMKERTFENYGVPVQRRAGIMEASITSGFDEDVSLVVKKTLPLQATVLGYVINGEVGLD
jgi:hypothetical protein